ncbi:MAG: tRNA (guanosine(37)-N1)-methyltransferase TrmD [Alphaproteobacteria bacterium]|nr:tRNA (guanosine(37)-N1)-methyltransferase TrmD [Alphaproteobacteria bacterium]
MWRSSVLTIFPELFPGPLGASLTGRGLRDGLWSLDVINIRDFATDRHHHVDDTPAGGGPGMVMRVDVLARAVDHLINPDDSRPLLYVSPRGKPLNQARVRELSEGPGVVVLAGRFEGIDERLIESREAEEISIGDFILSGGEIAAMALIESCVRLLPGIMGKSISGEEESFENGLLEYPHYTRPRQFEGLEIPLVLTSGDHLLIARWRAEEAKRLTKERRPDLWARYLSMNAEETKETN